jgi:hypothetical protein
MEAYPVTSQEPIEQPDVEGTKDAASARKEQTTPGDAAGVPVPSEHAVEGSSQEFTAVDGVLTYPEASEPPRDPTEDASET